MLGYGGTVAVGGLKHCLTSRPVHGKNDFFTAGALFWELGLVWFDGKQLPSGFESGRGRSGIFKGTRLYLEHHFMNSP